MPKFFLLGVLLLLAPVLGLGQEPELAAGSFLVSSRDLSDPNFAETVILLLRYDEDEGAMGLIVNRRGDVPLARVFEDLKGAKGRKDLAYLGGPVEPDNVLALLKSSTKIAEAQRVFSGVYLISDKELLEKTLADKAEPSVFHVYLGYAGWGPGQLEHEVDLGAWHILPPDAGSVFDADPDSVWTRLIRRTELRIAGLGIRDWGLVAGGWFVYPYVIDQHFARKDRRAIG
jgi:putative transcriptional regulator